MRNQNLGAIAILGLTALGSSGALAETIQINYVSHFGTTYNYNVVLTSNSKLKAGANQNVAVLFDFPDLASAVFTPTLPSGWAANLVTEQTTSLVNYGFIDLGSDSSGLTNVRIDFSGTGNDLGNDIYMTPLGQLVIQTNSLNAAATATALSFSRDYNYSSGNPQFSLNFTNVPDANGTRGDPVIMPTPLAATGGFALMGLVASSALWGAWSKRSANP
jgi:hypothetical protein